MLYKRVLSNRYILPDPTREELWFILTNKKISDAIADDNWKKGQQIAIEWAVLVCERLSMMKVDNWKFIKRSIVERWFGRVDCRRFPPGWTVLEAHQYAECFQGRSIRFSIFPKNAACYSESYLLPANQRDQWKSIISQADNSFDMEMFPESSSENSICFRRFTSQFGEIVAYEAGAGQAMFVFEQERGQHPVVSAIKTNGKYIYRRVIPKGHPIQSAQDLEKKLRNLIKTHDEGLANKCRGICRMLGIDQVSIEGYFDPVTPNAFRIVDVDLPFDYVFMVQKLDG